MAGRPGNDAFFGKKPLLWGGGFMERLEKERAGKTERTFPPISRIFRKEKD